MTTLTAAELEQIQFHETMFEKLRASLIKHANAANAARHLQQMAGSIENLRTTLNEVRAEDMVNVASELHVLGALAQHKSKARKVINLNQPYFGYLQLQDDDGHERQLFIGDQSWIDSDEKIYIVNWHESPFAEVFFNHREGEAYDIDLPNGRTAVGTVKSRTILSFQNGKLIRLDHAGNSYIQNQGAWMRLEQAARPFFMGGEGATVVESHLGSGITNVQSPIVKALLDPQQYALIQHAADEPLLIIGSAGSGKTTVALLRMQALYERDPQKFAQHTMLVVVPERGLECLTRRLLNDLGLPEANVRLFDAWVVKEGRKVLKNLPRMTYSETPTPVRRFKGHRAFQAVIKQYAQQLAARCVTEVNNKTHIIPRDLLAAFTSSSLPIWQRVEQMRDAVRQRLTRSVEDIEKVNVLEHFLRELKGWLFDWNHHREELFGNETLLDLAITAAQGDLQPQLKNLMRQHIRAQLSETEKERYQGYEKDALETMDGRSLDDDTPDEIAGSIDVEDFPVLLLLLHELVGALRFEQSKMRQFRHIVLDEAQEYSPLELRVIGHCLKSRGSITVAGDAAQQTDLTTHFRDWQHVLTELGVKVVSAEQLNVSYRSTKPIMEFAHHVLGPLAPSTMAVCKKDGPPVTVTKTTSIAESLVIVGDVLRDLFEAEPYASVAVICHDVDLAREAFIRLNFLPRSRLVIDGEFTFRPGIDFTDVNQVKGLEFDYIIVPDANEGAYPEDSLARRRLHVAVTRAIHQAWIVTGGKPSSILP